MLSMFDSPQTVLGMAPVCEDSRFELSLTVRMTEKDIVLAIHRTFIPFGLYKDIDSKHHPALLQLYEVSEIVMISRPNN